VPTRHRRIPVTNDPELAEALARVEHLFAGAPAAKILRDLALRGAQDLERERTRRAEAIERLVEVASRQRDLVDWDVLETIEETAWGE
jgi:hypothetical protein